MFSRLREAREIVEDWLMQYKEEAPLKSLGDLTPFEYLAFDSPEASTFDWH